MSKSEPREAIPRHPAKSLTKDALALMEVRDGLLFLQHSLCSFTSRHSPALDRVPHTSVDRSLKWLQARSFGSSKMGADEQTDQHIEQAASPNSHTTCELDEESSSRHSDCADADSQVEEQEPIDDEAKQSSGAKATTAAEAAGNDETVEPDGGPQRYRGAARPQPEPLGFSRLASLTIAAEEQLQNAAPTEARSPSGSRPCGVQKDAKDSAKHGRNRCRGLTEFPDGASTVRLFVARPRWACRMQPCSHGSVAGLVPYMACVGCADLEGVLRQVRFPQCQRQGSARRPHGHPAACRLPPAACCLPPAACLHPPRPVTADCSLLLPMIPICK